ncbi:MAG: rhomboid family intramembrane serine protease [Saprospiraceae bacterium]|nr:rhomboid family intramembrane serine protease [Saprospiraceae bacterium]
MPEPIVTYAIIAITAIVSIQAFSRPAMIESLKHSPYREVRDGQWYRLLSSGFVHGGWIHLLINMFVLYEFGRHIEVNFMALFGEMSGRLVFLLMYLLTIMAGDLPTLIRHQNNPAYASIGASGAVSGVVFIFIMFYPWEVLYLYGILPIPALVGGIAYLAYSSWASKRAQSRIDHLAHFYGAVFGMLFISILKPAVLQHFIRAAADLPF